MTGLPATYDSDCNAAAADDEFRETTTLQPPQDPFRRRDCTLLNRSASMTALYENEASYDSDCDAAADDDNDDALKSYYVQGIVGDAIRARLVVKDKLLRKKSCSEEGSQGQHTLTRGNSCPDLGSSLDTDAAAETQASSLPAIKIGAGFFKSYAQHIKHQRAKLSGAQTS
jgi:hypothetical protein